MTDEPQHRPVGCTRTDGRAPTARDANEVARFAKLLGTLGPVRRDTDGRHLVTADQASALADYHSDDPEIAEHYRRLAARGRGAADGR